MPRLVVRTPKYRLHKATGQAVVTLDGRDHYLGRHNTPTSRENYLRLVGRWQLRRAAPDAAEPASDLTLNELFVRYWRHVEVYYRKDGRPTTEQRVIKATMRYVLPLYGATPAAEFGPLDLKTVRQNMVEAGLNRVYINQSVDRVRRMFRWAVENELVPPATSHSLQAVAGLRRGRSDAAESAPVRPADPAIIDAALQHMARPVAAMVQLQMATAMRPGELVLIRPADIDRTSNPWLYTPQAHKTEHHGRPRRIYLGPKAQEILAPFLQRAADRFCFSPSESVMERRALRTAARVTPVQYGNRPGTNRKSRPKRTPGDRYEVDSYRRAIDRACEAAFPPPAHLAPQRGEFTLEWRHRLTVEQAAELKAWRKSHRFHPHQLRHNAATFLARTYGIEAAQVVLGHATLSVTGIYAERDFDKAAAIMRQVG